MTWLDSEVKVTAGCRGHKGNTSTLAKVHRLVCLLLSVVIGPSNGPVLFYSLASVVVVVVCNTTGGWACGQLDGPHCTAGQSCYVPFGRHLVKWSLLLMMLHLYLLWCGDGSRYTAVNSSDFSLEWTCCWLPSATAWHQLRDIDLYCMMVVNK